NVDGNQRRTTYCSQPGLYGGLVFLFDVKNAELLAILNDGFVQHARVAATAALGIKYLSQPEAEVLAIIGSGGMARPFALAAQVVRPLKRIQAFSPNRAHLDDFLDQVAHELPGCELVGASTAAEAAAGAQILSLCTNSQEAVLEPAAVSAGMHVT